jgi:hypothetical protein
MSDDIAPALPEVPENSETWAIVELMGRSKVAGRISRDTQFGTDLLMLDVPFADGFVRQFLGSAGAIFRMTMVDEEVARDFQNGRDLEPGISLLTFKRWQDNQIVKTTKEMLSPDYDPDFSVGKVETAYDRHGEPSAYIVPF